MYVNVYLHPKVVSLSLYKAISLYINAETTYTGAQKHYNWWKKIYQNESKLSTGEPVLHMCHLQILKHAFVWKQFQLGCL